MLRQRYFTLTHLENYQLKVIKKKNWIGQPLSIVHYCIPSLHKLLLGGKKKTKADMLCPFLTIDIVSNHVEHRMELTARIFICF